MSDRGNAVIQEQARYKKMKLICILEGACLETVKTKKVCSFYFIRLVGIYIVEFR